MPSISIKQSSNTDENTFFAFSQFNFELSTKIPWCSRLTEMFPSDKQKGLRDEQKKLDPSGHFFDRQSPKISNSRSGGPI